MDVVAAFRDVGTYRGTAEICGVDPKTVKRKVLAHEAGELDDERAARAPVPKNTGVARTLAAQRVEATKAKITAKRLLVEARADGYAGSARNFRRLVAEEKKKWRARNGRQRRPAVWTPGDTVVIDRGTLPGTGIHVFGAVLAWSRIRFVRYARDETAATTLAMLAECFELLGGVSAKVLADRMGCLKAGTVAGVVIPTPDYVRFATHYGFSPDFCHAGDPASKGLRGHAIGCPDDLDDQIPLGTVLLREHEDADRHVVVLGEDQAAAEAVEGGVDIDRQLGVLDRLLVDVHAEAATGERRDGEPAEVADVRLQADELPPVGSGFDLVQRQLQVDSLAQGEALHNPGQAPWILTQVVTEALAHAPRRRW